jgi:hypothetical protein
MIGAYRREWILENLTALLSGTAGPVMIVVARVFVMVFMPKPEPTWHTMSVDRGGICLARPVCNSENPTSAGRTSGSITGSGPVCREEFCGLAGQKTCLFSTRPFRTSCLDSVSPAASCVTCRVTTFTFLDGFFDCYVSAVAMSTVSQIQYGLSTPCIYPFMAPIDVSFVHGIAR